MGMFTCTTCGQQADRLEEFPGGICLGCYAASQQGQPMPTAEQIVAMWGGPVRRQRRRR